MPAPAAHAAPDPGAQETMTGYADLITYHNPESSYTVLRFIADGSKEPVVAVGQMSEPAEGEPLKLVGTWKTDARYGRQFAFAHAERHMPTTLEGLERFLGSGVAKGLGPKMAKKIVDRFGEATVLTLDKEIHRLREIPGLGAKLLEKIRDGWASRRGVQEVMSFLQGVGITPRLGERIVREYGARAMTIVRENPYRLARDLAHIGFRKADTIAKAVGFAADSPERAEAAVLYLLDRASGEGHCFVEFAELKRQTAELLGTAEDAPEAAIVRLFSGGQGEWLMCEKVERATGEIADAVYGVRLHKAEDYVAEKLVHLLRSAKLLPKLDPVREIAAFEERSRFVLAPAQREALERLLHGGVGVLTGGPGTGKTTLLRAFIHILKKQGATVLLVAPTGRAAKRLEESARHPARTIHRQLAWDPQGGRFLHGASTPLKADVVVVDEASMLDVNLAASLLRALSSTTSLLLVGDVDQLPSVGPGDLLRDLIASGVVPVARLDVVFRQARASLIVRNAHRINHGEFPIAPTGNGGGGGDREEEAAEEDTAEGPGGDAEENEPEEPETQVAQEAPRRRGGRRPDFYMVLREEPDKLLDALRRLVCERIPASFGFDPANDVQVLVPMHRNTLGSEALNVYLQQVLNPRAEREYVGSGATLGVGDKVIQTKNNYDLDVFNGDIGRVTAIDRSERSLRVDFDGREVIYDFDDAEQLQLAFAISIHKSQGSEYPAVVVVVHPQHHLLLQRNLLYTAVTRGRKLVVLLGSARAIGTAVHNARAVQRNTALAWRLRQKANEGI